MSFLKSRSGATLIVGCPDVVATAPDGYTLPMRVDPTSNSLWFVRILPPFIFYDSVSSGSSTSYSVFGPHTAITAFPYAVRMMVSVSGEVGFGGATATATIQIRDEAGTPISPTGVSTNGVTIDVTSAKWSQYTAVASKDYAAGSTAGFQIAYKISAGTVYVGANTRVDFYPI